MLPSLALPDRKANTELQAYGAENSRSKTVYDNLNRVTQQTTNNQTTEVVLSRSDSQYDNRGRVFLSTTWAVNQVNGNLGNSLTSKTCQE